MREMSSFCLAFRGDWQEQIAWLMETLAAGGKTKAGPNRVRETWDEAVDIIHVISGIVEDRTSNQSPDSVHHSTSTIYPWGTLVW